MKPFQRSAGAHAACPQQRTKKPVRSRDGTFGMIFQTVPEVLCLAIIAMVGCFALQVMVTLAFVSLAQAQTGPQASQSPPLRIVALGDSLTAGFGMKASEAFPAVLEQDLRSAGLAVTIDNAGVSGETASGGLARLEWAMPEGADMVIVELGANDMLRNISPDLTRKALSEIIERLQAQKIFVVLAGMESTTNWGADYKKNFDAIYPGLSKKYGIPLYPSFLAGVAGDPKLTLPDGLHPNAAGAAAIARRFSTFLAPVIKAQFPAKSGWLKEKTPDLIKKD